MTHKQKDNQLLEEVYSKILEGKMPKCPECGCNPSKPEEECDCDHDCDHDEHEKDTVEEAKAKGKKPNYLDVDGDRDKKEPMKKALKEKGKHATGPKKGKTKKEVAEALEAIYNQIVLEHRI